MTDNCKYLNFCLNSIVSACYASPETCDIYKRNESKDKPFLEQVAEIIKKEVRCEGQGFTHAGKSICRPDSLLFVDQAATEISKLLLAELPPFENNYKIGSDKRDNEHIEYGFQKCLAEIRRRLGV